MVSSVTVRSQQVGVPTQAACSYYSYINTNKSRLRIRLHLLVMLRLNKTYIQSLKQTYTKK